MVDTFKGAEMSFYRALFLGVLLLSFLMGRGVFHINGTYDLDNNGQNETLVLNSQDFSAMWIEVNVSIPNDTIWTYSISDDLSIADGEVLDLNGDGLNDLVLIPNLVTVHKAHPWLYVFPGDSGGFSEEPLTFSDTPFDLKTLRPTNLTIIPENPSKLGVCFASPIRQGVVFDIEIINNSLKLNNSKIISGSIISNGYGVLQIGGFTSDDKDLIAIISAEEDKMKTAIFDIDQDFKLIHSKTIELEDARYIFSPAIQPYQSKNNNLNGLLIPCISDNVYLLSITGENVFISTTSLSNKKAFPTIENNGSINTILKNRKNVNTLERRPIVTDYSPSRIAKEGLLPPSSPLDEEVATLNSKTMAKEEDFTTIPKGPQKLYYKSDVVSNSQNKYSMLSPTLGDFLTNVKQEKQEKKYNPIEKKKMIVPQINIDMASNTWADEAGFTQLELGEFIPEVQDSILSQSPIPSLDTGITTFSDNAKKAILSKERNKDTSLYVNKSDLIDLYYVLIMTPASNTRDRYVFDGEAPFGVAVNQVPKTGKATHFQHGVSANLVNLTYGETFDFAYSLRDARLDSITTLTMVHDMQTNLVLMSISPTDDSLSQSYQPESFDPKLFEFPNYFFEGFPNSLNMDFSDKLIRFSFNGVEDSLYQGIYLSSTTPSNPPQSLAVFLDEGIIQSVRGEVIVRANGSKKITTEYDLVGSVKPAVMFSQLIQENFSEDLKTQLLQGSSLEQPLFGPKGKLPKITREPRLPDVDTAQPELEIPVEPKTSNVPESSSNIKEKKEETSTVIPTTQKNERMPSVLEVDKKEKKVPVATDSLQLEQIKEISQPNQINLSPAPDKSQEKPIIKIPKTF